MTSTKRKDSGLLKQLPSVRGTYEQYADLARLSWFRVGGLAEVLYIPADAEDLSLFLKSKPSDVPITIIGLTSNLLIRDGGIPGVVIRLSRAFNSVEMDGTEVRCGANAADANVSTIARNAGIEGLEFLTGIPGTIGGALRMNAGAFGRETQDILVNATSIDGNGQTRRLSRQDMGFGYRHCDIPSDWVFTGATFRGTCGDPDKITLRMREIRATREESQPVQSHTGGSTFTNPGIEKAWRLIEAAGCRGLRKGGAMVSTKHCNFLVNTGTATAADLEDLGEDVRRQVRNSSGITLGWEIQRIGVRTENPRALAHMGASES